MAEAVRGSDLLYFFDPKKPRLFREFLSSISGLGGYTIAKH